MATAAFEWGMARLHVSGMEERNAPPREERPQRGAEGEREAAPEASRFRAAHPTVGDHAKARVFAHLDSLAWWSVDRRSADPQC